MIPRYELEDLSKIFERMNQFSWMKFVPDLLNDSKKKLQKAT